jgi:thiol-disulfide isomerase/thioredoxin
MVAETTTAADARRRGLLVFVGSLLALPPAAAEAPLELALQASDGLPVLGDGSARAIYLDFWASWCAPCRLSFPWMNEMHDRHAERGLRIVAVGLDRREDDARRFVEQTRPRFPIALDPSAVSARRLDVQAMPSSFLFSAGGLLLHGHRGFRLEDRAELERRLQAAVA